MNSVCVLTLDQIFSPFVISVYFLNFEKQCTLSHQFPSAEQVLKYSTPVIVAVVSVN